MNGLGALALAALAFVGSHFLLSYPPLRGILVERLGGGRKGEGRFAAVFFVVAFATFFWLIREYNAAPYVPLWDAPEWTKSLSAIVMPLATLLFVGSLTQRNPTMGPRSFASTGADPAPGMLKITRHPMLWSFGLWGAAHLPAGGHGSALILFGALTFLALVGTLALDAKRKLRDPEGFARFAAATSNIPFAAMLAGRTRLGYQDIGWWRLALAVALYFALLFLHPYVSGRALV
jgi:uncharacterized membrane protein